MAKKQTFADKVARAHGGQVTHCPTCGDAYSVMHVVEMKKNTAKNGYRFNEGYVRVCKCNEQDVKA